MNATSTVCEASQASQEKIVPTSRHYRPYIARHGTPEQDRALSEALSRLSRKKNQGNQP